MTTTPKTLDMELFVKWVHSALSHLYDAPFLQSHPLGDVLLTEDERHPLNRSQNLRRVLLDAIQSLRPELGRPALSPDWRGYRIMELRYIEGLSPAETMEELKVGKSQFFRDQARILKALEEILWSQIRNSSPAPAGRQPSEDADPHPVQSETGRLLESATWETLDLAELIRELHPLVASLYSSQGAELEIKELASILVHADRVMARQALLKAFTHAMSITLDKHILVRSLRHDREARVRLSTRISTETQLSSQDPGLGICTQLMSAMGGKLQVNQDPPHWEAVLAWPETTPRVLLIVDDNDKIIDLFRRYLSGQDWVVKWATNGTEAFQKIAEGRPTVIMLDVMIPGEDGWEILMRIRKSPDTLDIPVIICSVVQEPQLAQSLGATGYLPKPVSQLALVNALAPYASPARTP
jgi:CheY-like chemotaxis protein